MRRIHFAAQISTVRGCTDLPYRYVRLERPAWVAEAGVAWVSVKTQDEGTAWVPGNPHAAHDERNFCDFERQELST